METSIDLYADEYAGDYVDLVDESDEQDLENQDVQIIEDGNGQILDGDVQVLDENAEAENKDENEEEKKPVKPKRVIRNPRPKLDFDSLKGRKGLLCLQKYFKNNKLKGRDHEEEDLRSIMKTYEYWCHRLYPKFTFDDCLEKIEKLGTKKNVQVYLKRIRLDMVFDEEEVNQAVRSDNEDEIMNESTSNEFDNLLQQSTVDDGINLTEEQLERIRINKEKARMLRERKLHRQEESFGGNVSQDNSNDTVGLGNATSINSQDESTSHVDNNRVQENTDSIEVDLQNAGNTNVENDHSPIIECEVDNVL